MESTRHRILHARDPFVELLAREMKLRSETSRLGMALVGGRRLPIGWFAFARARHAFMDELSRSRIETSDIGKRYLRGAGRPNVEPVALRSGAGLDLAPMRPEMRFSG